MHILSVQLDLYKRVHQATPLGSMHAARPAITLSSRLPRHPPLYPEGRISHVLVNVHTSPTSEAALPPKALNDIREQSSDAGQPSSTLLFSGDEAAGERRLAPLPALDKICGQVPAGWEQRRSWAERASRPCRQPETLRFFIRLLLLETEEPPMSSSAKWHRAEDTAFSIL